MKAWRVSDIRWANLRDLQLPFWQEWNRRHRLPPGFWQRIWEYPYVASRIPAGMPVLDVGGTYPFVLFRHWPHAVSVDARDLNALDHVDHQGQWPEGRLIVADAAAIPVDDNAYPHVFSISALEEMPHVADVLSELLRVARHRVVVTADVSDELGLSRADVRELERVLGVRLPPIPADAITSIRPEIGDFGQPPAPEYRHIRVLGMTIDATTVPKSTAILVPHWESWPFLERCVAEISAHRHPHVDQHIYVLDDASRDGSYEAAAQAFRGRDDIDLIQVERPDQEAVPDVGRLLDIGLERVEEQYVASIDADLFPLSDDWLAFPLWLIERYGCSAVGLDTGLSCAYVPKLTEENWWQPLSGYLQTAGLYDNDWFACINNLYRVMPTALARVVSEQIGFSCGSLPRRSILRRVGSRLRRTVFPNHAPRLTSPAGYLLPGMADNGVAANHFLDVNRLGPKYNIPLTSWIGFTPTDGVFGQNICGLVFHFALSTRALVTRRPDIEDPGDAYRHWAERMTQTSGIDDSLLAELVEASTGFEAGAYDRSIPTTWYEREHRVIEEALAEYRKDLG